MLKFLLNPRSLTIARAGLHLALLLGLMPLMDHRAYAADTAAAPVEVTVTEPLMELHTGPGRGYPVFYVAERGEKVQVLMRRTDWFRVRSDRGTEGWVSRAQMEGSLMADGVSPDLRDAVLTDYLRKRLEAGFAAGRFNGDPVLSFRASYLLTPNVITELSLSQVSGTYSGSQLYSLNLQLQPYTETRFLPYFTVGTGIFENRNRASLVGSTSSLTASTANAGLGMRFYLRRNFMLRLDFREYVALSSVEKNDRFDEEQIGFSFFF
jgi:hypothetical protein